METTRLRFFTALCALFVLVLAGCGGGGGGSVPAGPVPAGSVKVSLTDAPTTNLDHVWITVKEIRFHRSEVCDDPEDGGWLRYPLATPVTIDLVTLNNGKWTTLWDGIVLPVGNYQQIRVILADTNDPLTPSAIAKGLSYNNQVSVGGAVYPLTIPAARNGIKLVGSFQVTTTEPLHIVVDFDVTHDVVATGSGKFVLKPRLKYFIVSVQQTAAIVGTLLRPDGTPFANFTDVFITAEAPETITFADSSSATVMGITRSTTVSGDGTFVLYPLPASPGKTYDLVVRGEGVRTMILRDVPAVPGTTKDAPSMFNIEIGLGQDYLVSAQVVNADTNPYVPVLGASVGFYQTLPGAGEVPYLIRFRHVNPLFGTFGNFPLAFGNLLVGTYDPKALIQSFAAVEPLEGPDSYTAFASAPFFWSSGPKIYSPAETFKRFLLTPMSIQTPPECDADDDGEEESSYDKGYFVTSGGLIVDHIRKHDLEDGDYDFDSASADGKDIKHHHKGDKVDLNKRKPIKIKVNFNK